MQQREKRSARKEMAVDPSKLKKPTRRGLGAPPTDGSPGIEDDRGPARGDRNQPAVLSSPADANSLTAAVSAGATRMPGFDEFPPPATLRQSVAPAPVSGQNRPELRGADEGRGGPSAEDEDPSTTAHTIRATGRGRGEQPTAQGRQRVPAPAAEARIPFTTRVSVSTKERLEDACHFLRVKHQDFINQAIVAHLKKHGF
jgi:hypothetical protein